MIQPPFEDEYFKELWHTLLEMKKWKKKPESAINLAAKKLSEFDVGFAIQLVEAAIMGNYQGVVFPDTKIKYQIYKNANRTINNTGSSAQGATSRVDAFRKWIGE